MVCEIALRFVGYSFPTFYTTDQERGYGLRPNAAGWYRKEGETYVRINSAGMRDREHTKAKLPNTLRIAVVGDSYAEALQVPIEQAFWSVMVEPLKKCPAIAGRNIEVLNFGVSGYGTAQELITVKQDVFAYSPDVVLLAFTTNNDITDNSRVLKGTDEVPYFVFRDGQLTLDNSFQNLPLFRWRASRPNRAFTWLRNNSRVLQGLHQAHYAFKNYLAFRRTPMAEQPAKAERKTSQQPVVNPKEIGIDNLIYRPPVNRDWEDAWRVTEGLLIAMRDEVKNRGAKFVVMVGSNGPQVLPDPMLRAEVMSRIGATDLFYPDFRLRELARREVISFAILAPELQAYAQQHQVYLHGFGANLGNGHWNAEGHRISGELVGGKICEAMSK